LFKALTDAGFYACFANPGPKTYAPKLVHAQQIGPRVSFLMQYLDPTERLDELLFALIMALSITLGVCLASDEDTSALQVMWAVIGCNLAWGLIDGCMHIVTQMFDRSSKARLVQALRSSRDESDEVAIVGGVLDSQLSALTSADERRALYLNITGRLHGSAVQRTHMVAADVYGGLAIVRLMVLATIPAIAPFLWLTDRLVAGRVSNGLVLLTLFGVGYGLGRSIQANPWTLGLSTAVFGLAMVIIVVLLGG